MTTHTYRSRLAWTGTTAGGYRAFDREHLLSTPEGPGLALSADPAFRGRADHLNPEQLVVMAASSCQFLSFVSLAARRGVDVRAYADDAHGSMTDGGASWIEVIELRPRIEVAAGTDPDLVQRLVTEAHETCYVARSLRSDVRLAATVAIAGEPQ